MKEEVIFKPYGVDGDPTFEVVDIGIGIDIRLNRQRVFLSYELAISMCSSVEEVARAGRLEFYKRLEENDNEPME